jgi:hypothetical protein
MTEDKNIEKKPIFMGIEQADIEEAIDDEIQARHFQLN